MLLKEAATFARQCAAGRRVVTRFAPSPNGSLHLGHAYAAIAAHDFARAAGGKFLLRIEDIDGSRSRTEHVDAIIEDLKWLELDWDDDVIFQSARIDSYRAALERLKAEGLIYRCSCTRSEIADALKTRPVRHGPDGPVYPGCCRGQNVGDEEAHCWRLDMAAAAARAGPLAWHDLAVGEQEADPAQFGDVVIWRKDAPASYHLAATLDDAADGISHVVRGEDLLAYSASHRLLRALLDLPEPVYWHHRLILDEDGEKLSKSRKSAALSAMRCVGIDGVQLANRLRKGELPLGMLRFSH
ncbi:MAG: tRNA glutamyl-Q(34) synthetase GluQRS [Sphingorhabdus sp.]